MKNFLQRFLLCAALAKAALGAASPEWPQFRGPGGSGVSDLASPPILFGPETNVLWKKAILPGYSSPIVAGNRIFLTVENEGRLETIAFDLRDGHELWRKIAAPEKIGFEEKSSSPRPATSTPATDGVSVFAFFGAIGVFAYDLNGKELWQKALPRPDKEIAASPILIDDKLIIVCDVGSASYVEALDKTTGRSIWRTERERMRRSFSSPFHWVNDKRDELIVAGSYWLTSYDPKTGVENWRYSGTAKSASSTPAGTRALLFSVSMSAANESTEDAPTAPSFDALADLNQIVKSVLPTPENAVLAIHSCGKGEINATHLAWKNPRNLPGASSPLFYAGRLFTLKSGGFVSAYNIQDGRAIYQDERLNAPGDYYASPVAADGRIYFISQNGVVTVIDARADTLTTLGQSKLGEQTIATPALAGKTVVVRGEKNLYAFGVSKD